MMMRRRRRRRSFHPLEIHVTYSNSISFERIFAKVQSERKS